MKKRLQPFSTSLMGSMPRSEEVMNAQAAFKENKIDQETFDQIIKTETEKIVQMQEAAGIEVIVHGELTRDNYMSFVAEKVDGIDLMTLEEIAELATDKSDFEESLAAMDADDNSMNNPVATKRIATESKLDYEEMKQLKAMTDRPVKATIPSPYLLTRSMWLDEVTGDVYEDRRELGEDVVKLVKNEVRRLIDLGVDIIQMDEPILSDIVFNREDASNSFY